MLLSLPKKDKLSIKRKYLAEAGLNLYSSGANVFRPADLYKLKDDSGIRGALEGCNIYMITRRRRIIVDPHSLRVDGGRILGKFVLPDESDRCSFESFHFRQDRALLNPHGLPCHFVRVDSKNSAGTEIVARDAAGGAGVIPAHYLISVAESPLPQAVKRLEVLYIGQAFGASGGRLAVDRLFTHTTLQRILAESHTNRPDDEILILMFRFEHARNILSTGGSFDVEPSATSDQEAAHLDSKMTVEVSRKSRITLTEAALINYFKPQYNKMHSNSFAVARDMRKLKTLKSLFQQDFSALIVEVNTADFGSKIYSAAAPQGGIEAMFRRKAISGDELKSEMIKDGVAEDEAGEFLDEQAFAHIARYPLYDKAVRESFLHDLAWGDHRVNN